MDYSTVYLLLGLGAMLLVGGWLTEDGWPGILFGAILLLAAAAVYFSGVPILLPRG